MQTSVRQPIDEKDLLQRLHVDSDHRHDVKHLLCELIAAGDLVQVKKHKFALPEHVNAVVGYVQANPKGFAFVIPKNKDREDVYISPDNLNNAFHGDLVVTRLQSKTGGKLNEGKIIQILQRGKNRLVGTYYEHGNSHVVIPEDPKIPYKIKIDESSILNAKPKQIVAVQLTDYDESHRHPEGEIVEVLGFPHTEGLDEKIVMYSHNLSEAFPDDVLEAAEAIPIHIPEEEVQRRRDLRDECIFTIDGENARDFDDAVSIERLENANYKLGVHIADVSYYVEGNSPIDWEAYHRATSVYFPDRAIPMLPEQLSNNICSLKEGVDRLTVSVFMELDPTMKLVSYDICPSIIRSKARLTYTGVRRMLKDDDELLREQYKEFIPSLEMMKELSELLLQKRMRRGSLDFDLPEPELVLDMQGRVENIIKAERNLAHRLIEEFMIAANETVATHLSWMHVPSLYRTHESPEQSRISTLNGFLGSLGLRLQRGQNIHPKDFQKLLNQVRHKPIEHLINTLALRAMKQASYTVKNSGHFGLASQCYTHFTSPIRRYPDLIVHRILKQTWEGEGFSAQDVDARQHQLETIAEHSSMRERLAMEAEREIILVKKLRFMEDKLGEVFAGVISGVTSFGLFIELKDFFVEGLVHITQLQDDYYHYQEEHYRLIGEQFRKIYRIGDTVNVQVAHVDVAKRQIDFYLL